MLHAIPADANGTVFNALLDRAKEIGNSALTLPERSTVDQAILDKQTSLSEKLTGIAPPAIAKPQTA